MQHYLVQICHLCMLKSIIMKPDIIIVYFDQGQHQLLMCNHGTNIETMVTMMAIVFNDASLNACQRGKTSNMKTGERSLNY